MKWKYKGRSVLSVEICGVYSHVKCYGLAKMTPYEFEQYTHSCINCSNTNIIPMLIANIVTTTPVNHNTNDNNASVPNTNILDAFYNEPDSEIDENDIDTITLTSSTTPRINRCTIFECL